MDSPAPPGLESGSGTRWASPTTNAGARRHVGGRDAPVRSRRTVPFFHDGTERPINRPCDAYEQTLYYSGKKKCHTLKNIVLIAADCHIRFLSATYEGRWHDKSLVDDEVYALPLDSILYQDLGFQGFMVTAVQIQQPHKKPRGGELTPAAKAENRQMAQMRIRIEHVMSSIKRCRIVKDKLRLWREHIHDRVMETCCGLHNVRLQFRPWTYSVSHQS